MSVNLCACQTKKQTNKKDTKTQLTMVLDWTPNTNHTGLYVAEQKGYFADEGLEVEIVLPPDDGATDMVVSGNAEFGIDAQDNLAEEFAGDQNINVTAVAAILQHNTAVKRVEGNKNSTWVLMDFGDVIVHIFDKEDRLFYDLERIWADGKVLQADSL